MSRMRWFGRHLEEMSDPELGSAHLSIRLVRQDVVLRHGEAMASAAFDEDLAEISQQLIGRWNIRDIPSVRSVYRFESGLE